MRCPICGEIVDTSREYVETRDEYGARFWHWLCWKSKGGE